MVWKVLRVLCSVPFLPCSFSNLTAYSSALLSLLQPLWPPGCSANVNKHVQFRSLFLCLEHLPPDVCRAHSFTCFSSFLNYLLTGGAYIKRHSPPSHPLCLTMIYFHPSSCQRWASHCNKSSTRAGLFKGRDFICVFHCVPPIPGIR